MVKSCVVNVPGKMRMQGWLLADVVCASGAHGETEAGWRESTHTHAHVYTHSFICHLQEPPLIVVEEVAM